MKYKFIDNLTKKEYDSLFKKYNGNFMQSYEWGKFKEDTLNHIPHYVGLKLNNKLVCAALLLETKEIFKLNHFYSPRGFLIDYSDKELLSVFTKHLYDYVKKHNGIYLKIDPEIEYHKIDDNGNVLENEDNNYDIFNNIVNAGYKHKGFNIGFEHEQPRFTFLIDTTLPVEEIEKNINKSIMKKIRKTYEYDMVLEENVDVHMFYNLICNNSLKDDFIPFHEEYYNKAFKYMDGIYKMFELSINPKQLINKLSIQLEETNKELEIAKEKNKITNNIEDSINRINKMLDELENYKDEEHLVLCSQIVAVSNDKMYTLYIGNAYIGQSFHAVNRMYHEMIKYAHNNGIKYLDLFGTSGDVNTDDKHLSGIHNFKKNFGGRYTEFIGEFDLVISKNKLKLLNIYTEIYLTLYSIRERIRDKKKKAD